MRRADWVDRLWQALREAERPFVWGEHDCCLFAAKVLDAIGDSNWTIDLRSCYHDEESARAYIEEEGGIAESVTRRLGPPIPAWRASRGDVVLLDSALGPTLGVCVGAIVATAGPTGVVFRPVREGLQAWRVD